MQYGVVKRAEHLWKGILNDKSQISPVPPEEYGERFIKFITSITTTKEEAEREKQSHDGRDASVGAYRHPSRTSTDKATNKAGAPVSKSAVEGASEDSVPDRTLAAVRSPSPDKANGVSGAILPVVEEDGEANSREESMNNEKPPGAKPGNTTGLPLGDHHPLLSPPNLPSTVSPTPPKDDRLLDTELPPIPHLARLSMTETLAAQAARAPPQG